MPIECDTVIIPSHYCLYSLASWEKDAPSLRRCQYVQCGCSCPLKNNYSALELNGLISLIKASSWKKNLYSLLLFLLQFSRGPWRTGRISGRQQRIGSRVRGSTGTGWTKKPRFTSRQPKIKTGSGNLKGMAWEGKMSSAVEQFLL